MDFSQPPRDVLPERLFRLLLRRPRPILPIDLRLPVAPHVALSVRGLTALEDAEVADVDPALPQELVRSTLMRRLIAAHLLADGALAFASAEEVGGLTEHELATLGRAVFTAATIISPTYRASSQEAWRAALEQGARHSSNHGLVCVIASASEPLVLPRKILEVGAPERYFSAALADLTDGQIMAFTAAKAVYDKATG